MLGEEDVKTIEAESHLGQWRAQRSKKAAPEGGKSTNDQVEKGFGDWLRDMRIDDPPLESGFERFRF